MRAVEGLLGPAGGRRLLPAADRRRPARARRARRRQRRGGRVRRRRQARARGRARAAVGSDRARARGGRAGWTRGDRSARPQTVRFRGGCAVPDDLPVRARERARLSALPEQEQAVARRHEPLLLAAGAGSGKTSVLVERFVRAVCEDGVRPRADPRDHVHRARRRRAARAGQRALAGARRAARRPGARHRGGVRGHLPRVLRAPVARASAAGGARPGLRDPRRGSGRADARPGVQGRAGRVPRRRAERGRGPARRLRGRSRAGDGRRASTRELRSRGQRLPRAAARARSLPESERRGRATGRERACAPSLGELLERVRTLLRGAQARARRGRLRRSRAARARAARGAPRACARRGRSGSSC